MPGAGDAIQFVKAGVFEIATGYVVNKADLPGVDTTVRQVRESLDTDRPIWPVSSLRAEGLEPLCDWIVPRKQPGEVMIGSTDVADVSWAVPLVLPAHEYRVFRLALPTAAET